MSNPAVLTLISGKLDNGQNISIEDNFGESIHIHIGEITFYLTISEFETLVESFIEAGRKLFSDRGLCLDDIDFSAFDWTWLTRYKHILSIQDRDVYIKDLYTINKSAIDGKTFWHYVHINSSKDYRALMGDKNVLSQYNEFYLYGQNGESRLKDLFNHIKKVGYPFDNKYIIVNQYGVVYDGAHRAAILAYLYGKNTKIPVKEIVFDNDIPVEEYNKIIEQKVPKRKLTKKIRAKIHSLVQFLFKRREKKQVVQVSVKENRKCLKASLNFNDFSKIVDLTGISHFYINKIKTDKNGQKISDIILVVDKFEFPNFIKKMEGRAIFGEGVICFEKYNMLYSLDRPYLYRLNDICVLVCGQIFTKSLFFDSLLPVDTYILNQAKASTEKNEKQFVSEEIVLVITILDAIFEKEFFSENDKTYLKENKEILMRDSVKKMLEKEFFKFTNQLITLIINERFEEISLDYFKFKEY